MFDEKGGSDKLKLDYGYGTTANNGNVLSQSITVKRSGLSDLVFDQTYNYDSLNRIKTATEMTGETENWKQTFQFDRYGNRNFDTTTGATTTLPESFDPDIYNPTFNATNNRMATGQGWTYDAAGNVIVDPEGRSFFYDGENKQVEVRDAYSSTVGEYYFDGDGKRVKKVVPSTGEVTVFVYDASGKMIAEYSTIVADTNDAKVQYLTNDHLGSPRIKTDADGDISSRTDYMPYGEEIIALGGRSSDDDYVGDDVRQGFTGYEGDDETNLDYAIARMYGGRMGRYSSPDPMMASAKRIVPQSWNRYVYVVNKPLRYTDPNGMAWGVNKDHTEYCFLPGKAVCKGYTRVPYGTIIVNPSIRGTPIGYAVRLTESGYERVVPVDIQGAPRQWINERDLDALMDIEAGLLCTTTIIICPGAMDNDSGIKDKVEITGNVIQIVFLVKSLVKLGLSLGTIAAVLKENPEAIETLIKKVSGGLIGGVSKDFFEGTRYSDKVVRQMGKVDDLYHSFPELIKVEQSAGTVSTVTGGDGVVRQVLRIPGSVNGKKGMYEFIKDTDGVINHRLFVPDP